MIRNTVLLTESFFYALGNTPAVSLTQDLPPEQDADILLLGCGDARNILFTCFVDAGRKIDVTCNDVEPGIHARNILLYTLLIGDPDNLNIERIWNIYYHWKLDEESLDLLEDQIQKLLDVSDSIELWNTSTYGSSIRFCDERSLSLVRSYWTGYLSRGLSVSEKVQRQKKLQTTITRAKSRRNFGVILSDLRAVAPVFNAEAMGDLTKVSEQWWDHGTTPSSTAPTLKANDLNPTFLYSPNEILTLHYGTSPIIGFPLCTAYVPITKESVFHSEHKGSSSAERLVDCAKNHFKQWASAFRKAVKNKSVIRILCGDALAVCCTLRHCLLALPERTTSLNLFCDNWTNSPLKLHPSDYVNDEIAAPLSFDVIDTSNLVDHLGPLNIISVVSSLLKFNASSCLYTEMLLQFDSNMNDRLSAFFGVDVRTMSLLLGLVLPDLYTNVADSVEDDLMFEKMAEMSNNRSHFGGATQVRSRLRWRRSHGCSFVNVEAAALAKLLNQVHDAMFDLENPVSILGSYERNGRSQIAKQANPSYNRASFAMVLNVLKTTVVSDWDQCITSIYNKSFTQDSLECLKLNSAQDLILQMHLYGVDNGRFPKPDAKDLDSAVLIPKFPSFSSFHDLPEQLCVTMRVPRAKLGIFTGKKPEQIGCPALVVSFQGADPGDMWLNFFSSVQIAFGKWRGPTKQDSSHPYIEEDSSQLSGSSDLFASVFVPTVMLTQAKRAAPWVQCGLKITPQNAMVFRFLGPNLVFTRSKMTDKDVYISRYMPGMSALPAFAPDSKRKDKPVLAATIARLSQLGTKIDTVVQRLTLDCPSAKAKLANSASEVSVKFESPLKALVRIAQCREEIEFPVPVSLTKYKVRVARKSSYIEVETHLFDPLEEDSGFFMFPTFMTAAPGGTMAPLPWTSTRVDLDAMPPIDLKDIRAIPWLNTHASSMFSERECRIRESKMGADVKTDLKDGLFSIFIHYTGLQGPKMDCLGLSKKEGLASGIQTLIFPSCLRLDLVNRSVVLDTAMIPLTYAMFDDPKAVKFLEELNAVGLCQVFVSEGENRAWKAMMPALVERCRTVTTWKHISSCEYMQTGKVPLTRGLNKDGVLPICSCGIGKFPTGDYLASQMKKLSKLSYMISRYGARAAISLVFTVPYVEGCYLKERLKTLGSFRDLKVSDVTEKKCKKCGRNKRESNPAGEQSLLVCARCKTANYCSRKCQKADWKNHKQVCLVK